MPDTAVKVNEVLVLGKLPVAGHTFFRLGEPNRHVVLLPETLLLIEQVPVPVRLYLRGRIESWAYVRYSLVHQSDQTDVPSLDVGSLSLPLNWFPAGITAVVSHIPLYTQPPFERRIWPPWQMPRKKKWLQRPDIHQ